MVELRSMVSLSNVDLLGHTDTDLVTKKEFVAFVEGAEKHLYSLFDNIDRDRSGKLNKSEIRIAFDHAGLSVSKSNLEEFFSQIDKNNDGVISFEEWWLVFNFA